MNASFDGSVPEIEGLWNQMYSAMRVRGQTGGFMLDRHQRRRSRAMGPGRKNSAEARLRADSAEREAHPSPAYTSGIPGATAGARVENALQQREQDFATSRSSTIADATSSSKLSTPCAKALGDDAGLAVDALWRLSRRDAPCFGRELDSGCALWLERRFRPKMRWRTPSWRAAFERRWPGESYAPVTSWPPSSASAPSVLCSPTWAAAESPRACASLR